MNITCVYTTEAYNTVEKPLSVATEIPFGIAMIATVLENEGHSVELLVITPDTSYDEVIKRNVDDKQPPLYCFTAVSTQYWQVKQVAEYVREIDPSIFLLLGGHHSSLNSEEVIDDEAFDAICVGEGEQAVISLAESLSENRKIKSPMLLNNNLSLIHI